MNCKAQIHNWQLQLNQTGLLACRLVNNSKKGRSYRCNVELRLLFYYCYYHINVEIKIYKNSLRNDRRRP